MKGVLVMGVLTLLTLMGCSGGNQETDGNDASSFAQNFRTEGFKSSGLATNTEMASVPLNRILDGGPGKDGIPAIHTPKFLTIENARKKNYLMDATLGITVQDGDSARFYPYSILVWHEIVNDEVGGKKIAVTFCPLCGSAIVFDRVIHGKELIFGVSGKLYESNLLMYDTETESLWSQSLGRSVVGDMLGEQLEYIQSNVLSFQQFREKYPGGKVLSDETGFIRSYGSSPYYDYETNDILYFPVSNKDARLPKKEILYVVNHGGNSIAFVLKELREHVFGDLSVDGKSYNAQYDEGEVKVYFDGVVLPGYYEMWFSWITHNKDSRYIFGVE